MGGRGGNSGLAASERGFEYKSGTRSVVVQKTLTGVTLVNGSPSKVDFETLQKAAKSKTGYKELAARDLENRRHERYRDYNSHDYETLPNGRRGVGKTVYRPRRKK